MTKILSSLAACTFVISLSLAGAASAQSDAMKKDSMKTDTMSKDVMSKDAMSKDAMATGSTKADCMHNAGMEKDTMRRTR